MDINKILFDMQAKLTFYVTKLQRVVLLEEFKQE